MAFTDSHIFRPFFADVWGNSQAFDLDADVIKAALYGNSGTPSADATSALSSYNAGAWVTANEVSQVGQWAAGGVALANKVVNQGTSGVVFFDADDAVSGAAATLANVYGVFHYDDTLTASPGPADQGVCFNYLGGPNSVTGGVFTVQYATTGIARVTV